MIDFSGIIVTEYTMAIAYDASDNPEYVGEAPPGTATSTAKWRIKKITWSGSLATNVEWADGDTKFDNIWDDRPSLSYS